ncbi:nuclear transport factor 2 family protein [Chloroflexota bacterium]
MNMEELEAEVKTLKDSHKILEDKLRVYEDIEEIKRLQRIYGFYLEHWMSQEIVDLFSDDPSVSVEMSISGVFTGKEGIKRYFFGTKPTPEFLHQVLQVQPVIDITPDGKSAQGRWYGWGLMAIPMGDGIWEGYNNGLYECEYVKEDGKWKFKKIHWNRIFMAPYSEGWVKPERKVTGDPVAQPNRFKPDLPTTTHNPYPSGITVPFHFKHPITGK